MKILKRLAILASLLFVIYALGFLWFAFSLPTENRYPDTRTDAIITLTGERFRITYSIKELARGNSPKLFISGVYSGTPMDRVIDQTVSRLEKSDAPQEAMDGLRDRIFAEHKATSTLLNAIETEHWITQNNIESIRLMTSFYHMPRSNFIFSRYMPTLVIVQHPLPIPGKGTNPFRSRRLFSLTLSEYHKYMVTYLWSMAGGNFETLARWGAR